MAADDIFHVQVEFENPSGNSSLGMYYREIVDQSTGGTGPFVVAKSWTNTLTALMRAAISSDWWMTAVIVRKMINDPAPMWREDITTQVGLRGSPALPANNAAVIGLKQGSFGPRSDGRFFLPGIAEADTAVGVLTSAYMAAALVPLRDALLADVQEISGGTGRWELGVISDKVLNATPPLKDWDGAFADVIAVSTSPIIGTQRRRGTKVRGYSV